MPSPVPQFTRTLAALAAILHKAEAHAAARKIDPTVILQSRLYPDMFTLTEQVQLACANHVQHREEALQFDAGTGLFVGFAQRAF